MTDEQRTDPLEDLELELRGRLTALEEWARCAHALIELLALGLLVALAGMFLLRKRLA